MPASVSRWLSNQFAVALLAAVAVCTSGLLPRSQAAEPHKLAVRKLGDPGPLEIVDGDTPVLRYNYQLVPEPAEVKGSRQRRRTASTRWPAPTISIRCTVRRARC